MAMSLQRLVRSKSWFALDGRIKLRYLPVSNFKMTVPAMSSFS